MIIFTIPKVVEDSEIYDVDSKLVEIESELECPDWMLGHRYKYWLLSMRNMLKARKKELDKSGYVE
jgi:hypothetical protein